VSNLPGAVCADDLEHVELNSDVGPFKQGEPILRGQNQALLFFPPHGSRGSTVSLTSSRFHFDKNERSRISVTAN
jgi:hypothetical protein